MVILFDATRRVKSVRRAFAAGIELNAHALVSEGLASWLPGLSGTGLMHGLDDKERAEVLRCLNGARVRTRKLTTSEDRIERAGLVAGQAALRRVLARRPIQGGASPRVVVENCTPPIPTRPAYEPSAEDRAEWARYLEELDRRQRGAEPGVGFHDDTDAMYDALYLESGRWSDHDQALAGAC